MLTLFTLPKPFTDPHIRLIQRNAIGSWKNLHPDIDIILMGNDAGISETAHEFGVRHIHDIAVNEFGTPLLDSAFKTAAKEGRFDTLMFVNADIIFLLDLITAIETLKEKELLPTGDSNAPDSNKSSLTVGRRVDLDVNYEIDFNGSSWPDKLARESKSNGVLHSWAGIDYFIFSKGMFADLPPFAVGRVGWDNWMVAESRRKYSYTIDATACITAIHQNHGYSGNNAGPMRKTNLEALKNNSFTKDPRLAMTIEDCDRRLTPDGLKRNYLYWMPSMKRCLKYLLKR